MAQSPTTQSAEGSVRSSRSGSPNLSISESPQPLEVVEHACPLCAEKIEDPRILSCLHVFCMHCLEKQVEEDTNELRDGILGGLKDHGDMQMEEAGGAKPHKVAGTIICSSCKQETILQGKGVEDLPVDIVLAQMLDKNGSNDLDIICTSCKARENAVARCSDCANFLCAGCVTAHQYMRCFENHKVVSFEDLQDGDGMELQKPMFCSVHITETLKYFCAACQVPICQECTTSTHMPPVHSFDKIADIEAICRKELKTMITESKGKIKFCEQASSNLEGSLSDLQMQRDNARGLIEETFQTYRTILEKVQNELVKELKESHHKEELGIMDMFHNIEKTTERIEDGCEFAERVLDEGNSVQLMTMKKLISSQLLLLINNTPKLDINVKIDFVSNEETFENAMKQTFGRLEIKSGSEPETKSEDDEIEIDEEIPKVTLPEDVQADLVSGALNIPPGLIGPHEIPAVTGATDFLAGIPPLSLTNIVSLASSISAATETISSMTNTMPALSSERSSSRNSYSPAMSDSGISVDAASTSSATTQPLVNVAGLSKIGTVGVNSQGQITLNNQPLPGLTFNNVTGLPQALSNRAHTPTPPSQAAADPSSISNLLNSVSLGGSRSHTPQLPDIPGLAGLLGQSSGLNGMAGMNPITGASGLLGPQLQSPGVPGLGALQGNLGLSTPPPMTPTFSTSSGSSVQQPPFPTRTSGKMSAMQIRQLGLNNYDGGDLAPNLLDGFRYLNGAYGACSSGLFLGPRCKFGQLGPGKGQFNSPHGFCLGFEEDIIVADTNNHRVQVFEKTGEFKYQFGIPGREEGQLWYPRKVAVIRHTGRYVVCDRGNERSRMQIFNKVGHFIKKIAIRYIDIVAGLAITSQGNIVAVDSVSPTVFCIEESGNLLKWFDCSDYMREPSDIAVAGKEYFVCDFKGHCVVVFNEDGQFLRRIGCESITNFPNGIDISDAGDVLVGDSHGNRFHVAVFQRDGSLIGEFECPYVKVSRCCGLRITSEGYVVTLAKNNHHVLVLNTLYIA